MVIKLSHGGCGDGIVSLFGCVVLMVRPRVFLFFYKKKQANSLINLSVERSSGVFCFGGFVSLSAVAKRVRVLLM